MESIDAELAQANILTPEGESRTFESLYTAQRTLIVFVRHFGCIFCRERLADLADCQTQLDAHGMRAVVIGNGTPYMAEAFQESLEVNFPLYTDPSRTVFKKAQMKRSFGLGLATISRGLRSWKAGHRQGAIAGDPWQQGGCLIVDPNGQVLAADRDRSAGEVIDFKATIARAVEAR